MIRYVVKLFVSPFPAFSNLLREFRDLAFRNYKPIKTKWGFKFGGNREMASGSFEPIETQIFRELITDVDLLVNIGANIGYYCCHALSMGKSVVAIEPIPKNIYYLLQNIDINGWAEKIEVFQVACSNSTSIIDIWGGDTGASILKDWAGIPREYVKKVPSLTLDRIIGSQISDKRTLILVDIEGAEYLMLKGAQETLMSSPPPIWMVEITFNENQPKEIGRNPYYQKIFDIFFDNGYEAFTADKNKRTISRKDVQNIVEGIISSPVYNFIFKKK